MYTIKKLVKAEVVDKPPEDILRKKRRTDYDKVSHGRLFVRPNLPGFLAEDTVTASRIT